MHFPKWNLSLLLRNKESFHLVKILCACQPSSVLFQIRRIMSLAASHGEFCFFLVSHSQSRQVDKIDDAVEKYLKNIADCFSKYLSYPTITKTSEIPVNASVEGRNIWSRATIIISNKSFSKTDDLPQLPAINMEDTKVLPWHLRRNSRRAAVSLRQLWR